MLNALFSKSGAKVTKKTFTIHVIKKKVTNYAVNFQFSKLSSDNSKLPSH